MNIASRIGCWAGGWKNPYVTDGIVAMFDGEWNAGFGAHNAHATIWKDLVSGNTLDLSTKTYVIHDRDINFLSNTPNELTFDTRCQFMSSGIVSLQYVGSCLWTKSDNYNNTQTVVSCSLGSCAFQLKNVCLSGYVPENGTGKTGIAQTSSCLLGEGTCHGATTILRAASTSSRYLGQYNVFNGYGVNWGSVIDLTNTNIFICDNIRSNLTINSIRVYGRELTADEIAANYAIDKARFGLT